MGKNRQTRISGMRFRWKALKTPALALVERKSSALLDWFAGHTYTRVPGEGDDVLETLLYSYLIFTFSLMLRL